MKEQEESMIDDSIEIYRDADGDLMLDWTPSTDVWVFFIIAKDGSVGYAFRFNGIMRAGVVRKSEIGEV